MHAYVINTYNLVQSHPLVTYKDEELAHVVEHSPLILEVRGSILTPNIMLGHFLSMLEHSPLANVLVVPTRLVALVGINP